LVVPKSLAALASGVRDGGRAIAGCGRRLLAAFGTRPGSRAASDRHGRASHRYRAAYPNAIPGGNASCYGNPTDSRHRAATRKRRIVG